MARNKKMAVRARGGGWKLREFLSKERRRSNVRLLLKCGCCEESVEIHYASTDDLIEINGVCASRTEWLRVLGPILKNEF